MTTERDAKNRFIVITKEDYLASYTDPYKPVSDQLAKFYVPVIYEKGISTLNNSYSASTDFQKAIQLKEVKVTGQNGPIYKTWGANRCGDYVCVFHILNCPSLEAAEDTLPIIGQDYTFNGTKIIYQGCAEETESMKPINGIFLSRQYLGSDYTVSNPTKPQYASTIFGKHLTLID